MDCVRYQINDFTCTCICVGGRLNKISRTFHFTVYTIVTPPEEGNIVRIEERNNQQKKRRLAANANFTQVTSYNDLQQETDCILSQSFMLKINSSLSMHYLIHFFFRTISTRTRSCSDCIRLYLLKY